MCIDRVVVYRRFSCGDSIVSRHFVLFLLSDKDVLEVFISD